MERVFGHSCGEAKGPVVRNMRAEWGLATVRVHRRGHRHRAIQADQILAEKRRRGWFSGYPEEGSNLYLLALDQVYKVRVLASTVWVPEVRCLEPEVFIIVEGINFTVEDTTRTQPTMWRWSAESRQEVGGQPHNQVDAKLAWGKRDCPASRHPAIQGVEAGSHGRSGQAPPAGDKKCVEAHGRIVPTASR